MLGRAGGAAPLPGLLFRIEQRAKHRLIGQRCEIGILARDQTIAWFQLDRAAEVFVGAGKVA